MDKRTDRQLDKGNGMNHIEAMKLALEALEFAASQIYNENDDDIIAEAIAALRQALEQPEQTVSLEEYKRLQRLVTSQGIRLMEYESKQEPVAWMSDSPTKGNGKQLHWTKAEAWRWSSNITPLYTAPPKREWIGLTDEEIFDVIRSLCADNETAEMLIDISMDEYRAIEAKLKERNT